MTSVPVKLLDWGVVDYAEALVKQQQLFDELIAGKAGDKCDGTGAGWIVMCEHPHVYTLGKNGRMENMLVSERFLRELGARFFRTDRGGDITYHGPGQIICYPVIDLEKTGMGLRGYIETLEQGVIDTLAEFGIESGRSKSGAGVWVSGGDRGRGVRGDLKICAVGVHSSHFVTRHGLALNVTTDLGWFEYINPCGFQDSRVTSMEMMLGYKTPTMEVRKTLAERLAANFGVTLC